MSGFATTRRRVWCSEGSAAIPARASGYRPSHHGQIQDRGSGNHDETALVVIDVRRIRAEPRNRVPHGLNGVEPPGIRLDVDDRYPALQVGEPPLMPLSLRPRCSIPSWRFSRPRPYPCPPEWPRRSPRFCRSVEFSEEAVVVEIHVPDSHIERVVLECCAHHTLLKVVGSTFRHWRHGRAPKDRQRENIVTRALYMIFLIEVSSPCRGSERRGLNRLIRTHSSVTSKMPRNLYFWPARGMKNGLKIRYITTPGVVMR